MNINELLILQNGKDILSDVVNYEFNTAAGTHDITFKKGKTYSYAEHSVECIATHETLENTAVRIYNNDHELFNVNEIWVFHAGKGEYWRVHFSNGSKKDYARRDLTVIKSCLNEHEARNCIAYLREIADINELKSDDGVVLLKKQYDKLDFVGEDTALAGYLNPDTHKNRTYEIGDIIFPFGGNASQFTAVENALKNQFSVIQGPPGTGKTQTILNIIANLLLAGKTVQVVSNNNSATDNVLEKLASPKYNMGFLAAPLGKAENKKAFIQNQSGQYPDLAEWKLEPGERNKLMAKIRSNAEELKKTFAAQERLSRAKLELNSLSLEIKYFEQYCLETGLAPSEQTLRRGLKSAVIMRLWQECTGFCERDRAPAFWFKIKSAFIYGISNWGFYKSSLAAIITLFQSLFYKMRHSELQFEIDSLEEHLKTVDAKGKMDELTNWSMLYLRDKLFERYGNKPERTSFSDSDLWQNSEAVLKEYPIVLSTTFSARSCLRGVTYDYLIMDEASQVDIATGALALSSARNAIIVGDLKQLPNVIKDDLKQRSNEIFAAYKLNQGYSFSENSFLKSICIIIPDAPQTLLREHYRCHPKIIEFCNQKFYNGELVIMTDDNGEPDALTVFKTVVGNFRRDHMNQRQIDVTIREALPLFEGIDPEEVGIVAPYKDQVAAIAGQLDTDKIEVHTVHKFQGREKDTIVMTTVDDVVTDFSDDPYLLNVAVSRAKKRFCLIASGNDQPADSNIGDLISYIEYNNFQIIESKIYSVFDLLYQQYTEARIAFLRKHPRVSIYDSENLMYGNLVEILDRHSELSLDLICHQPLNMLIRDPKYLNDEECNYAMNTVSHVDFLIYNRISKKPVLAIEVDGFHYHKPGTRQHERDVMKDRILKLYDIPVLRFPTNGSDEIAQVERALAQYAERR